MPIVKRQDCIRRFGLEQVSTLLYETGILPLGNIPQMQKWKKPHPQGCQLWSKAMRLYESDPEGKCRENPYQDFWSFLCDSLEIHNGKVENVSFFEIKEYTEESWVKEVCDLFIKEFGEDYIDIKFSW